MSAPRFTDDTFQFLVELALNNDRGWFDANKDRYERHVKEPALAFVEAFGPRLATFAPRLVADPRPVGGSLFRIYRDVRFSKDKSPYKTHLGIRFFHADKKDVHTPGFYLHVEPGASFAGVGVWQPDGPTLKRIREAIVERSDAWLRARDGAAFRKTFEIGGDALKTHPRGFDPDHPLIEDLRKKDHVAYADLDADTILADGFPDALAYTFRAATPYARFLCESVGAAWDAEPAE